MTNTQPTPNFFGINLLSPSSTISYVYEPISHSFITAQGHLITIFNVFNPSKTLNFKTDNIINAIHPLPRGNHFITIETPFTSATAIYCSIYSISYTTNTIEHITSSDNILSSSSTSSPVQPYKHFHIVDVTSKNDFIIRLTPSNTNEPTKLYHININPQSFQMKIMRCMSVHVPHVNIKYTVMNWKDNVMYCVNKHKLFIIELNHRTITSTQAITSLNVNNSNNNDTLCYKCSSLLYIKESISLQTQAKYIVVLISNGSCLLYHPYSLDIVNEIHYEDYCINSINYNRNNNTLCCNTIEGCVFVVDIFSMKTKYTIDYTQLQFVAPIAQAYIEEQQDTVVIVFMNGKIIKGNLSNILKGVPCSCSVVSNFHNSSNSNNVCCACIAQQKDSNLCFYSCCNGNDIMKWYYRGDRWISNKYSFDNDVVFTYIKFHPKYQTTLFAGDSLGNIYIFKLDDNNASSLSPYDNNTYNNTNNNNTDTNGNNVHNNNNDVNNSSLINEISLMHRCKGCTCSINDITFNNDNSKLLGISYTNGMIFIYKIDNIHSTQSFTFECILKLTDEYITNSDIHRYLPSPSFMCFKDNQIIYLKATHIVMKEDMNYINNTLITDTNKQISYSKYNAVINDIKLHHSEKYLFVLLNTNQIDIRNIETFQTNAIVDVNAQAISNFTFDYSGEFVILNCIDKVVMYSLHKMKVSEYIDIGVVDIGNVCFLDNAKYMVITCRNGSLFMVDTPKRIKSKVFNYKDKEKEKGIHVMKEKFILDVNKNVFKLKLKKNKEVEIDDNEVNDDDGMGNCNYNDKTVNDDIKIEHNNDVQCYQQKQQQQQQNVVDNSTSSTKLGYLNDYKYSTMRTADSVRNKQMMYNSKWDKQHQYTRLGYTNKDTYLSLNKDPSIFPINQHPTLERINHKLLEGKSQKYPDMVINLVENESKRQQDNIRAININNAIYNMMQTNNSQSNNKQQHQIVNQQQQQLNNTSYHIEKTNNSNFFINNNRIDKPSTTRQQYVEPDTIDNISVTNNNNNNNNTHHHNVNTYSNYNYNTTSNNYNNNYNNTTNSFAQDDNKYMNNYPTINQPVNSHHNQQQHVNANKDISDFSIISTFTNNNCKYSIADDIDYLCDGIDKFENENKQYLN